MKNRWIFKAFHLGLRVLLAAVVLGCPASGFPSQERPGQKAPRVPRHDAAAVVKLVPVRVLDREGRPVTGLSQDDFVLYDNKELKTITEFEVHRLAEAGAAQGKPVPDRDEAVVAETGRKFFILLDIQGSDEVGNANSKKAALHFVETKLRPGDEAAVLYFAPMTGLNLAQYLTSDMGKIKAAIERAKEHPPTAGFVSGGLDDSVEERMPEQGEIRPRRPRVITGEVTLMARGESGSENPVTGSSSVGIPGLGMMGRSHADYQMGLSELAKAMQSIPGTKNVLLFSGRGVSPALGREFAASNTPIFTVNSKNWIERSVFRVSIKVKHIWEDHPLKELALASGGHYYADIKDVQTIADSIQVLTGHYYVLGYYVDEKWDGQFHEIKVEVKKPDCRVFVQEGYYNPKPFAQLSEIEKRLHLYDLAFSDRPTLQDPLELPVECLPSSVTKKANTLVLTRLAVDERTGIPPGREELFLFVFDKQNQAVFSRRWEMDFGPHSQKTFYPYFVCSLPPGEYECRLATRDLETGQSTRGSSFFQIPGPETSARRLDSPLLLVPGKEAQFIRLSEPGKEAKPAISILSFYPILPRGCTPLVKNVEAGVTKVWAIVPAKFEAGGPTEVELKTQLSALESGQTAALDSEILDVKEAGDNTHFVVLEISLPELDRGEYELEIALLDIATQTSQAVKTRLVKK